LLRGLKVFQQQQISFLTRSRQEASATFVADADAARKVLSSICKLC
jgi:hypothetical protein